jgi:hypothetical protein
VKKTGDETVDSMFDELISTTIKPDGTVEEVSTADHQAEAMREACGMFLTAERRFQKLSSHPDVVTNPAINARWREALKDVYEKARTVWRLFVGPQPTMADNKLYARFRALLLKGSSLKADA